MNCNHKYFIDDCESCFENLKEIARKLKEEGLVDVSLEGVKLMKKAQDETLQFINSALKGLN